MTKDIVRAPFTWYGGKSRHLHFILPNLPETKHYCEPFGGSAAVLLARTPAPIETYNDIDSEIVNFFRVLREYPDEIERLTMLTPYAREEYNQFGADDGLSELERARRFFFRSASAYSGRPRGTTFAISKAESRVGMSDRVSRYFSGVERLQEIALRLLRVQIENMDALELIRKYDTPETLFYCDPPYSMRARVAGYCYTHEIDDKYHRKLAKVLNSAEGRVCISGYRCDLYDDLYDGWTRVDGQVNRISERKSERQEILWMNYDPNTARKVTIVQRVVQKTLLEESV